MAEISLKQIEDMFLQMRKESKWNIDSDMMWGYFFTCRDKSKLQTLSLKLIEEKYRLNNIHRDERGIYWLHVERIERHNPITLNNRNIELNKVASEYSVEYDGMDVGPNIQKESKNYNANMITTGEKTSIIEKVINFLRPTRRSS